MNRAVTATSWEQLLEISGPQPHCHEDGLPRDEDHQVRQAAVDLRGLLEGIEMHTNANECVRMRLHADALVCIRMRQNASRCALWGRSGAEEGQKRDRSGAEWYAYECIRMRTVSNASECVQMYVNVCASKCTVSTKCI